MKILYRYISSNLVKLFLLLIAFFSVVIISSQLLHLPYVLYHVGLIKFAEILLFVNLSFFKYQIFFAFFISSLIVGHNLKENREIYAIYSTGISKNQLLKPFFYISIILIIFSLIVSLFIVPYANRERAKFITLNVKRHILDSVAEKNFMRLSDKITVFIEKKNKNRIKNIFIFNKTKGISISAKEALFTGNQLILKNGYIQIPSEEGFNILKFDRYSFILDIKYIKRYEFEDIENGKLLKMIKENKKDKNKAVAVLTDRITFGIPFVFIGFIGFLMGVQLNKSRDFLIGISVIISIIYIAMNTYSIKLIEKGLLNPFAYSILLFTYFGAIAFYIYRKD